MTGFGSARSREPMSRRPRRRCLVPRAARTAEGNLQTAAPPIRRWLASKRRPTWSNRNRCAAVKTEQEAGSLASANNPSVIMALFNDAAAKDAIDVAFLPAYAAGQPAGPDVPTEQRRDRANQVNGYLVTANVSMPIYQGGRNIPRSPGTAEPAAGAQAGRRCRRTAVQTAVAHGIR